MAALFERYRVTGVEVHPVPGDMRSKSQAAAKDRWSLFRHYLASLPPEHRLGRGAHPHVQRTHALVETMWTALTFVLFPATAMGARYEWVFFSDVRDVVFVDDPFSLVEDGPKDQLYVWTLLRANSNSNGTVTLRPATVPAHPWAVSLTLSHSSPTRP